MILPLVDFGRKRVSLSLSPDNLSVVSVTPVLCFDPPASCSLLLKIRSWLEILGTLHSSATSCCRAVRLYFATKKRLIPQCCSFPSLDGQMIFPVVSALLHEQTFRHLSATICGDSWNIEGWSTRATTAELSRQGQSATVVTLAVKRPVVRGASDVDVVDHAYGSHHFCPNEI